LFGIGLPSAILIYLAFRGIQNDQALLEQERRKEHQRIAERVSESVDENIRAVEHAFNSTIADYSSALLHSLDSLKQKHPLVEELFYFQNGEEIQLPTTKLLFLPNGSLQATPASTIPPALLKNLQTAQQYEFQDRQFQNALVSYRSVFAQVSGHSVKGELLSTIARVQKKSQLFQDAIKSYETIAQDYSHVRIADGIPLGPAARLEISTLFLAINDSLNAVKTLIELYRDLIHREWILEQANYQFFTQLITESLDAIFSLALMPAMFESYRSNYEILNNQEQRQRLQTEKLHLFQESFAKDLQIKIAQNQEAPLNSPNRFTLETGGRTYLISLLSRHSGNTKQGDGNWGLLLNADHLKNKLLKPLLEHHFLSEKTGWIIRGNDGTAILKSDQTPAVPASIKANFVGNFPPWIVEFYQKESPVFEAFLTSWRSIYFYMFILIAGIFLFGLIFTIRSVAHELELARLKSDFVSTISHEFKSPLTSIRQLSEMLKTNRVPSKERRFKYYDILVEQSERLSLLIDNILDFSKMEEGRKEFVFEKTPIHDMLQEIISAAQDRVGYEGFVIHANIADSLPTINVDRSAISQAINNLIDNAIKYSTEIKKVEINAYTENQYLLISVQDFGIGIRKDEINKIFERFFRGGDELTRTVKGSGLGLTLVKQIVDAHQGKIDVKSEPGKGSVFMLFLPIDHSE